MNYLEKELTGVPTRTGKPFAEVRIEPVSGHHSLHSRLAFSPGQVICRFQAAAVHEMASRMTVQTGERTHIILKPDYLQYVNHSCRPNIFFDTGMMEIVCLEPIAPGDEFSFFYPSTEWEMESPFKCYCGHSNCLGQITGAAGLNPKLLKQYRLTGFIQSKLSAQ